MDKLDGKTLDIEKTEQEKLKSIFPQCFVEGKLDTIKLLELVGEYDIKDYEKYEFTWHGKSECIKNAQTRSHGTLRPCKEESKNFDDTGNLYIEGDNLEVLKLLQKSYYGKVKMIYIDPPYNTGKDFVYKDNFRDNIKNYKEITSQTTKSNSETMGRFHTDWLNMMYPRLRLAYNLLKEDGIIFLSIDDNEAHNLRKLCDEIFGEENFLAQGCWRRVEGKPGKSKYIGRTSEFILIYSKNKELVKIGKIPMSELALKEFRYVDDVGKFRRGQIFYPNRGNYNYCVTTPYGNEICGDFTINKETFERLDNQDKVYWAEKGEHTPYQKIYLASLDGVTPTNTFSKEFGSSQGAVKEFKELFKMDEMIFDNPKPTKLIYKLLQIANVDSDDIILDFFSGSSTTAHAVMDLNKDDYGNRKYIMVQIPELTDEKSEAFKNGYKNICEIGKERIRRAGVKISEENPDVDTGFKVLKLDSTNLKIWDNTPIEDEKQLQIEALINRMNDMVDKVKEDRTDLDVVYEILLKLGYELTENVERVNFSGKIGYIVSDGDLVVCLESDVGIVSVEDMVKISPSTIVFAEDSFASTEDITNAKLVVGKILGTENNESVKFKFV